MPKVRDGRFQMIQSFNPGDGSMNPIGSGEHVVHEGECVISIADAAGHFWKTIWDDPANAEVKRVRGSPHVLLTGDRIHVREIRTGSEMGETEQRHRFRRKGIPIHFEMLVQENDKSLGGKSFILTIEGRVTQGKIPDDGVIKCPMMPQDRAGELRIQVGDDLRVYPLVFGHLDPAHTPSGARGRLQNLGRLGTMTDDESLDAALKRFQRENGLSETGKLDNVTASKLAEVHGS